MKTEQVNPTTGADVRGHFRGHFRGTFRGSFSWGVLFWEGFSKDFFLRRGGEISIVGAGARTGCNN